MLHRPSCCQIDICVKRTKTEWGGVCLVDGCVSVVSVGTLSNITHRGSVMPPWLFDWLLTGIKDSGQTLRLFNGILL